MIFLPDAEKRTIVSSFVWTKHRNVTDGQNRSGYYSVIRHIETAAATAGAAAAARFILSLMLLIGIASTRSVSLLQTLPGRLHLTFYANVRNNVMSLICFTEFTFGLSTFGR